MQKKTRVTRYAQKTQEVTHVTEVTVDKPLNAHHSTLKAYVPQLTDNYFHINTIMVAKFLLANTIVFLTENNNPSFYNSVWFVNNKIFQLKEMLQDSVFSNH